MEAAAGAGAAAAGALVVEGLCGTVTVRLQHMSALPIQLEILCHSTHKTPGGTHQQQLPLLALRLQGNATVSNLFYSKNPCVSQAAHQQRILSQLIVSLRCLLAILHHEGHCLRKVPAKPAGQHRRTHKVNQQQS
jgi:hypothetical protein